MKLTRRHFLKATAVGGVSAAAPLFAQPSALPVAGTASGLALEQAATRPVLSLKGLKQPVVIESVELLRKGREHFVRVRSKDGAEGLSVDDGRMDVLHPILNRLVIPYFIGKDARDLEEHLFGVYRHQS